ncbi:hypothetical protein GCM10009787_23900 [Streptomyces bangladeshensis]|uniref:Uncharacterized protein n=1 Tax=Streptomyces bangladeshensis TaxID=295352 RepID=A0ABP5NBA8_9ACTN
MRGIPSARREARGPQERDAGNPRFAWPPIRMCPNDHSSECRRSRAENGSVACRMRDKDHSDLPECPGVSGQTYLHIRALAALCIEVHTSRKGRKCPYGRFSARRTSPSPSGSVPVPVER